MKGSALPVKKIYLIKIFYKKQNIEKNNFEFFFSLSHLPANHECLQKKFSPFGSDNDSGIPKLPNFFIFG